jgi:diguanylate cyclase (GGDEF)-like protein
MIFAQTWSLSFTASMLLSVVATVGYVLGRRRSGTLANNRANNRHEILRALAVAHELESIAYRLRKALDAHVPAVIKFNARLKRFERASDISWHELCDRADEVLKPALRLSTEISHAYAEILQQMTHLATFAELRTDPLTGVSNRRAFDESLESVLKQQNRYDTPFSIAMLDIDFFKNVNDEQGHLQGDRVLQELAQLLRSNLRDCDILARYGGEEFVILMPHTELPGACLLAERIRAAVQSGLTITVSLGLTASMADDTATSLLSRADAALYLAKGAGRNCVYFHEGPPGRIVGIKVSPHEVLQPVTRVGDLPVNPTLSIGDHEAEPDAVPQYHCEAS